MLASKVERGGRLGLRWAAVENPMPLITWENGPVGGPLPPATRLDSGREIGIRFHIRTDGTDSDLTLQFHHACCDGAGFALFLRELLLAYALAYGGAPSRAKFTTLDPGKLAGRGRFGLTLGKLIGMAPKQLVGLLGARQFLMRSPAPIIPHHAAPNDAPPPKTFPAMLHYLFDARSTAALRKASVRLGVTSNDLLARDLFLALAQWRAAEQRRRRPLVADDGSDEFAQHRRSPYARRQHGQQRVS